MVSIATKPCYEKQNVFFLILGTFLLILQRFQTDAALLEQVVESEKHLKHGVWPFY